MSDTPRICIHGSLRRQCETCELADRLEEVEADNLTLREALADILSCFERGEFVRDTSWDGGDDWAVRAMKPLATLVKAQKLVSALDTPPAEAYKTEEPGG